MIPESEPWFAASNLLVGHCVHNLPQLLSGKDYVVITDENVYRLYREMIPGNRIIKITGGEECKKLATVEAVIGQMLSYGCDRKSFVLGFGGGIVTDISGFVASIYMRGISFGFVSTTLLSQVDASYGAKNGVNYQRQKNLIGVFRNPEFVLCDPLFLDTLSPEEYRSGLAEVIKHALIADNELFGFIRKHVDSIKNRDRQICSHLIEASILIKKDIVSIDPLEAGLRKILNFGHSFGHIIELEHSVKHGYAVASGMYIATFVSYRLGFLSEEEMLMIWSLLDSFEYSYPKDLDQELLLARLEQDKKSQQGIIDFVLLTQPGEAKLQKISVRDLGGYYHDLCLYR